MKKEEKESLLSLGRQRRRWKRESAIESTEEEEDLDSSLFALVFVFFSFGVESLFPLYYLVTYPLGLLFQPPPPPPFPTTPTGDGSRHSDSIFFGFSGRGTRARGEASEKIEKPKNWKVIPRGGNADDGAARCCCPERERERRRRRIRVYFSFLLPTSSCVCVYVDGKGEEEVVRSGVGKVVKYWTFASPPLLFFPSL